MLIDKNGIKVPSRFNDEPLVTQRTRTVAEVAQDVAEVVPDKYKHKFTSLADKLSYMAPEL